MTTVPHLLVCEDETDILDEISEYFREDGVCVTVAEDGQAAASCFAAAPAGTFTVVLTDLRMPRKDGASLAREIVANTAAENAVEVIVMSGHGAEAMRERQDQLGLFAVLQKPLNLADLSIMVHQAHDSAMARRTAAQAG